MRNHVLQLSFGEALCKVARCMDLFYGSFRPFALDRLSFFHFLLHKMCWFMASGGKATKCWLLVLGCRYAAATPATFLQIPFNALMPPELHPVVQCVVNKHHSALLGRPLPPRPGAPYPPAGTAYPIPTVRPPHVVHPVFWQYPPQPLSPAPLRHGAPPRSQTPRSMSPHPQLQPSGPFGAPSPTEDGLGAPMPPLNPFALPHAGPATPQSHSPRPTPRPPSPYQSPRPISPRHVPPPAPYATGPAVPLPHTGYVPFVVPRRGPGPGPGPQNPDLHSPRPRTISAEGADVPPAFLWREMHSVVL